MGITGGEMPGNLIKLLAEVGKLLFWGNVVTADEWFGATGGIVWGGRPIYGIWGREKKEF